MNRHIAGFLFCFLTLAFVSCSSPSNNSPVSPPGPVEDPDPVSGTWVRFVNGNKFPVSVYSDSSRQAKIADVWLKSQSAWIEADGGEASYYPVYRIIIDGVSFPYEGEPIITRIDADKNNKVPIHSLEQLGEGELNKPLALSAYLKIQNDSTSCLTMRQGLTEIPLAGFNSGILNGRETGVYVINPGPASGYSLRKNTSIPVDFPAGVTEFAAGRLYSFRYDGSNFTFRAENNLTIANAFAVYTEPDAGSGKPEPNPGGKTLACFVNDNKFKVSIYGDSSRQVKIADVEAQKTSATVQAAPNPGGAYFYPVYHIAINGMTFSYEGEAIIARIDAGMTTSIPVFSLEELGEAEQNKPLSASAYIKIQNDAIFSLTLRQGNTEIPLDGFSSGILNGGETGVYIISPGPASGYSFRKNTTDPVAFPAGVTEFGAGRLYSFRYDGTDLVLLGEYELTLAAILKEGGEAYPFPLAENIWTNDRITSNASVRELWYTFNVTAGTIYRVWWNDCKSGNDTKTLDITVSAYCSNGSSIFTNIDSAWTSPRSFTAGSSGTVKLRVSPYSGGSTGTYAITYSTRSTMPSAVPGAEGNPLLLAENTWADGNLPEGGEQWFKFTATAATQFIHGGSGTLPFLYVQVYDSGRNPVGDKTYLSGNGYISRTFTAGQEYYIKVTPYDGWGGGTYQIGFNSEFLPPGTTITALTADTWSSDNFSPSSKGQWFRFTATAATQYLHVSFGTKIYLYFQVYDSNGSTVGSYAYLSGNGYISRTLTAGQKYYIRVWRESYNYSGTYRIAFNTSSVAPAQ